MLEFRSQGAWFCPLRCGVQVLGSGSMRSVLTEAWGSLSGCVGARVIACGVVHEHEGCLGLCARVCVYVVGCFVAEC